MNERKKELKVEIDQLKFAFTKAREAMMPESEAINEDLTKTFWATLKDKIDHRELLNIAVRGEVRTGKSTVVLKIMWEINKYIAKCGLNKSASDNLSKYIFSDQTEFLRFIDGNERNIAIAIDEFNSMAKTGLNATTEEALFDYYSDVFAGQYIHRVTASPDIITDKNANIILDTIGKDEEGGHVRCKLIYRDVVTKQSLTIGRVDIYVGDLIYNWEKAKIRDIIEKNGVKNIEDQKKVDEYREKDFYVRYQVKKYKRMDLLKKEGVRDIRELEFSDIILGVLQELEETAKIEKIDSELVNVVADEVRRKHKRIYSILVLNDIGMKSRAILNIYNRINRLHKKSYGEKITPAEKIVYEKTINDLEEILKKRIEEQKHLSKLYRQYMGIN